MDDLLSRLVPGILDCLQGRLAVTEDSGRSHPRMRCSPVSESNLVDDVDGVQDPNQLGGVNGPSIHGSDLNLYAVGCFQRFVEHGSCGAPMTFSSRGIRIHHDVKRLTAQPRPFLSRSPCLIRISILENASLRHGGNGVGSIPISCSLSRFIVFKASESGNRANDPRLLCLL